MLQLKNIGHQFDEKDEAVPDIVVLKDGRKAEYSAVTDAKVSLKIVGTQDTIELPISTEIEHKGGNEYAVV